MSQIIETEETLVIETPERVQLHFALASIGNRFIAVAIDHFIQYFVIFLVVWAMATFSGTKDLSDEIGFKDLVQEAPKWAIAILIIIIFLLFAGYFVIFEWLWNGQTPGKRLMKLRVIREDGRPVTFWEALARNLLRLFDAFPGLAIPIYSVGLISIFLSNRDQRIGDLFGGTVVVRERADEAPTFAEVFSSPMSDEAFRRVQKRTEFVAEVREIKESEIEVVETFLRRRWDLEEKQRLWMAWRVALPLMYKIKPKYDLQTFTYEGFLEELLHRYHSNQKFLN
jgi:uncharacterized RDD family membrane protein YckC